MKKHVKNELVFKGNNLFFDSIDLNSISKKIQTPFYLYSEKVFVSNFNEYLLASEELGLDNTLFCYAMKANPNLRLLKAIKKLGAGVDIVSGGELTQALKAKISPNKIIFSGVGKTEREIVEALECAKNGIYSFNVESIDELMLIDRISKEMNRVARVAFRLNPNILANTHKNIQTGGANHKFGMIEEDILQAINSYELSNIKIVGLSIHIGSQLKEFVALKRSIKKMVALKNKLNHDLEFLDVGGGLGVDYHHDQDKQTPLSYLKAVVSSIDDDSRNYKLVFEPGRSIAATAGILVAKVIRTKESGKHHFTIIDAGLNDFMRPSLYQSFHEILPCKKSKKRKVKTNVVGPICETTDQFATEIKLEPVNTDDLIIFKHTGAYGQIMASNYNLRPTPKEYIISNKRIWRS